jgi:hypothetical protein
MIIVGFTGTRYGMSPAQIEAVTMVVKRFAEAGPLAAIHGDCIGSDEDFHVIARGFGARVEAHPGLNVRLRARCDADLIHPPTNNFQRNRRIVDTSAAMVATPLEPTHRDYGGTWYTVDYALKQKKPLALVLARSGGAVIEFSGGWAWPDLPKELVI